MAHMQADHPTKSYWQHLCANARGVVLITTGVIVLQMQGCFVGFEDATLDYWLHLFMKPRRGPHVVIVKIDEEDYIKLFNATSPLKPDKIREIIDAIALAQPRVIGVDLDTSTQLFREQYQDLYEAFQPVDPLLGVNRPPVIWARTARPLKYSDRECFIPAPILGGNPLDIPLASGIVLMPQDKDGVIRRYRRTFPIAISESRDCVRLDAFPRAVAKAFYGGQDKETVHGEYLILNFLGGRYNVDDISASRVLQFARGKSEDESQRNRLLRDKIVLLGGVFQAARDEYVTPFGAMAGVEVMAQAIESELSGGGFLEFNKLLMILMDLVAALAMVSFYYIFPPHRAFLASVVALPGLALLGSLVAFSALGYWANYVPLLAALWIHQLYHDNETYREMMHQEAQK